MKSVAGIDVSKLTLDVYFRGKTRQFANDSKGHREIAKWCASAELIVLEATGSYHVELACFLCAAGLSVAVVNPARAHYYAKSQGKRNKTDRVDAKTLSEFGAAHELSLFVPPTSEQLELCQLVRLRSSVVGSAASIKNRMQSPGLSALEKTMLGEEIALLKSQTKRLEQCIETLISEHDSLKQQMVLLTSITGIGKITAWVLMAELRDLSDFACAKKIAAFVGVCPSLRHSGTSLVGSGQLSRQGNAAVRKTLYMAALAAIREPGVFRDFFLRLVQSGKHRKLALIAVMHKLIRVAFGVVKSGSPFNNERTLTAIA